MHGVQLLSFCHLRHHINAVALSYYAVLHWPSKSQMLKFTEFVAKPFHQIKYKLSTLVYSFELFACE